MRRARNCDGNTPEAELQALFFPWAPDLKRCPNAVITQDSLAYLEAWRDWRTLDILPEPGNLGQQPAHIYQGIRACESVRLEKEHKEAERAEAQNRGGG